MGRVYQHEMGRRHSINMTSAVSRPGHREFKDLPMESEETPQLELAVGEPLPPGFEGEVTRKAQIQVTFLELLVFLLIEIDGALIVGSSRWFQSWTFSCSGISH